MRWLHALLLTERHLLSLTMSFLCCFFLRDYGSKRKSGKSPVFVHYPSLKLTSPSFLFQLVALTVIEPLLKIQGWTLCCMAYDSITLSVTRLLSMWCQCLVCLLVLLWDADLLSTVFWGGLKNRQALSFWQQSCLTVQGAVSGVINVCAVKRKYYSLMWQLGRLQDLQLKL